jgi:hypothetical protein
VANITRRDFVRITDSIWVALRGTCLILVEMKEVGCEIAIRDVCAAGPEIDATFSGYWPKALDVANEYFNNLRIAEHQQ